MEAGPSTPNTSIKSSRLPVLLQRKSEPKLELLMLVWCYSNMKLEARPLETHETFPIPFTLITLIKVQHKLDVVGAINRLTHFNLFQVLSYRVLNVITINSS
jgi:hypothetical protein